ncbi:MAG: hypothetical protein HZC51_02860 [Nitrospirae bacterium]|nr:hypothetical protein [Nitrospirota bacterium]
MAEKLALINTAVHFRLSHNGREALDCQPVNYSRDRVAQIYGSDFARGMVELERKGGAVTVVGFISGPGQTYSDKARQEAFVNGRPVRDPVITRALYDAYRSVLMKDRHPASILFISVDPTEVDVNVHPAKREVRFARPNDIHRAVFDAVTSALRGMDDVGRTDESPGSARTLVESGYRDRVREATESYLSSSASRSAVDDREAGRDRFPRAGAGTMPRQESMRIPRAGGGGHGSQPPIQTQPQHAYNAPAALQVADSYIILPSEDGFIVIDQHAAHERIQYERIKVRLGGHGDASQGLLVPVRLDLTAKEAALMRGIMPELNGIGIEVEEFGGGSFIIRTKPLFLEKTDVKEAVMGVLAEVGEPDVKAGADTLKEKVYQLMACKSAVKAGQRLHPEAINRLVKQLFECEMPYTCAHGRPTVARFGLAELEKMFKRK